jgi:threonine dehydratase
MTAVAERGLEAATNDFDSGPTELVASSNPTEQLGSNQAAHTIWEAMVPLVDGSERAREFSGYVPTTTVLHVPDEALPSDLQGRGHQVYFAADGQLPSGAYKIRGVMNALLSAREQTSDLREVVAASTGNHAAALALASAILGLECTVYMPESAIQAKIENTSQYGANVLFTPDLASATMAAQAHGSESGALFVHPYDDRAVVAGQGTMAANLPYALMAQHGVDLRGQPIDLYEPAGGGGVATGNAVAAKVLLPDARLHVVQARGADVLLTQLGHHKFDHASFDDAVDGAAVQQPSKIAKQVLGDRNFVHGRHRVTPAQIGEAMAVTSRFTDVYEPAGAMALAAVLRELRRDPNDTSIKIAHGTGVNTTPSKVGQLAAAAYQAGLLGEQAAFELVSAAHVERRPSNDLEEQALAIAALRRGPVRLVRHKDQTIIGPVLRSFSRA